MDTNLVFHGNDLSKNWLFNRYWYCGSNSRYATFSTVLNLLSQKHPSPVIVETGCQRLEEDLGGGMSTSIWAEYIHRYGGKLISVDISQPNLNQAQACVERFPKAKVKLVCSDSVAFLKTFKGRCDLLFLDSFDYPFGDLLNLYGGQVDIESAIKTLNSLGRSYIVDKHKNIIGPCQEHCLQEFLAIEDELQEDTILLIDDNELPGGGKPRLLKEYLVKSGTWICLLDSQASLWVRSL